MKTIITEQCALEDGLLGGYTFSIEVNNISVAGGAQIERGMLLAGEAGVYKKVSAASDAQKNLCIAAQDYSADSVGGVTTAYFSGQFNRNKINLGGASSLTLADFEQELRKQNIHLTEAI